MYRQILVHAGAGDVVIDVVYPAPAAGRRADRVSGAEVYGVCVVAGIEPGDVVAVVLDGHWVLRRYWVDGGQPQLVCDNPEEDPRFDVPAGVSVHMYPVIDVRRGRPRRRRT